jgi:cytochrome c oxidase cbb3-type subunit 3
LLCSAGWLAAQTPPDPTAAFTAADLDRGRQIFIAHCGPCHGVDGSGGRGANLRVPKLKRAADSAGIFNLAQNGIEGTSMDGAWQLSDAELWRVSAFVQSLGQTARVAIPGDPARGKSIFEEQNCAACHIVNGQGGSFGPELTAIGAQRSPAYLRRAVLNPSADVPPEFVSVRVRPRDGREITGIRLNEDSFTIQLKDVSNRLYSFRKSDLAVFEIQTDRSAMPVYSGLTPTQMDDLVAYLAGLRGQ